MPIDREKALNDHSQLKDFVENNGLRDAKSNIDFTAAIAITTASDEITLTSRVRIDFGGYDNYGVLTILDNSVDPNQFPTQLNPKWQTFVTKGQTLTITGNHSKNPKIGNYTVTIEL
jgi:hypothetical protein